MLDFLKNTEKEEVMGIFSWFKGKKQNNVEKLNNALKKEKATRLEKSTNKEAVMRKALFLTMLFAVSVSFTSYAGNEMELMTWS